MSVPPKAISVIIPVYNTEKYLSECLDSVLKQSFTDFELICVNDCSSDHSLDILNAYATKDQRITVIDLPERSGLAAARNAALKVAEGKYIYFVDSDDAITQNLLEDCFQLAEKENLDQIIFEADVINELETPPSPGYSFSEDFCNKIFKGYDLLSAMGTTCSLSMGPWLRFTKKKLLTENQISFPEGFIHEDNYFTIRCLLEAERVHMLKKTYYLKRLRANSIMTDRSDEADYQHAKNYFGICLKLISDVPGYLSCEAKKRGFDDSLGQVIYCFERDLGKLSPSSVHRLLSELSQNISNELIHTVLHFFQHKSETGKFISFVKYLAAQSSSQEPLITVILPTYNRREFLPSAIKCIADQTFKAWRLLVLNDGGEDVGDIVKEFNDPRIEYINLPHQGKPATVNHGLQLVKSKYIAYMDDDDEVFPEHLELLFEAAELNNSAFVYSDTYLTVLDENGNVVSKTIENDTDVTYENIRFYNRINHKQILHTKELADKVGLYDDRMSILIDYDYIKRLAKLETPYHVHEITGNHYLRGNWHCQISGMWTKSPQKTGKSLLAFFEKDPEGLSQVYQNNVHVKIENDSLKSSLADKNAENDSLKSSLADKNAENDSLKSSLADKNAENDSLKVYFNAINSELSAIKASMAFKLGTLLATPWRCCKRVISSNNIDVFKMLKNIKYFIYIKKSGQFSNEWYLSNNPDVAEAFKNSFWHRLDLTGIPVISKFGKYMAHPLRHYIKHGCHEHRKPTAFFDGDEYCSKYNDVNAKVINPFYHYLKYGIAENRQFSKENSYLFNWKKQKFYSVELAKKYYLEKPREIKGTEECIDIIIPVYNGMEHLKRLFSVLFKNTESQKHRFIIVDDCSPDQDVYPFLQSQVGGREDCLLLRNEENLGFPGTVNRAAEYVKSSVFVLLNTDVLVPRNWLERMVDPFLRDPKIATVTPFTNSAAFFAFPDIKQNNTFDDIDEYENIDHVLSHIDNSIVPALESITGIGFCMGIRKYCWDAFGRLDEKTFGKGYGEECDLCFRFLANGWKNILQPSLFVYHHHSGSFGIEVSNKLRDEHREILKERWGKYLEQVSYFLKNAPWDVYKFSALMHLYRGVEELIFCSCNNASMAQQDDKFLSAAGKKVMIISAASPAFPSQIRFLLSKGYVEFDVCDFSEIFNIVMFLRPKHITILSNSGKCQINNCIFESFN